jgi:hypothetical protein
MILPVVYSHYSRSFWFCLVVGCELEVVRFETCCLTLPFAFVLEARNYILCVHLIPVVVRFPLAI